MPSRWRASMVLCALSLFASAALAQPEDATNARALFREARALFEQGRTDEACAKFEQSERIDPAPGTELGLAACWEQQGKVASAWTMFGRAEASALAANRSEWAEHARRKRAELQPALPKLRLRTQAETTVDIELRLDGTVVARDQLGSAIPVDPGAHRIDASRAGHRPWSTTVTVPSGPQLVDVDVPALAPVDTRAPPRAGAGAGKADEATSGGWMHPLRIAGFATAGVGLVGVGLGAYFGAAAFAYDSDAREDCPTPTSCGQRGLDATDDARSAATASTIAFAVGAAALVGGIVLIVVAPKTQQPRSRPLALEVRW